MCRHGIGSRHYLRVNERSLYMRYPDSFTALASPLFTPNSFAPVERDACTLPGLVLFTTTSGHLLEGVITMIAFNPFFFLSADFGLCRNVAPTRKKAQSDKRFLPNDFPNRSAIRPKLNKQREKRLADAAARSSTH